jgi:hypothetical protein
VLSRVRRLPPIGLVFLLAACQQPQAAASMSMSAGISMTPASDVTGNTPILAR